jgi:hypothetical protein
MQVVVDALLAFLDKESARPSVPTANGGTMVNSKPEFTARALGSLRPGLLPQIYQDAGRPTFVRKAAFEAIADSENTHVRTVMFKGSVAAQLRFTAEAAENPLFTGPSFYRLGEYCRIVERRAQQRRSSDEDTTVREAILAPLLRLIDSRDPLVQRDVATIVSTIAQCFYGTGDRELVEHLVQAMDRVERIPAPYGDHKDDIPRALAKITGLGGSTDLGSKDKIWNAKKWKEWWKQSNGASR